MLRPFLLVLPIVVAPTATLAQDFCSALEDVQVQVAAARDAVTAAAASVEDLRFRIGEDPRRYRSQINALADPEQDAISSRALMLIVHRDIAELRQEYCPAIPDGR